MNSPKQEALQQFKQDCSIEEIADRQGKSPKTIRYYLEDFLRGGELTAEEVIGDTKAEMIRNRIENLNENNRRSLKQRTPSTMKQSEIRFVLAEYSHTVGKERSKLSELVRTLRNDGIDIPKEIVLEMGESGDEQYVPDLVEMLESDHTIVRKLAVSALRKIGKCKPEEALIQRLDDESPEVRRYTAKAVASLNIKSAQPKLEELSKNDPNDNVRSAAENYKSQLSSRNETQQAKSAGKQETSGDQKDTYEKTMEYVTEGRTIEQISQKRDLAKNTIMKHLSVLLEEERITEDEVPEDLPDINLDTLKSAIETVGSTEQLKPLKQELPEDFTYGMIRFGLALMKANDELD
ncbi:MAG: helix-turn-helix domain-containing protein [bacterium]